MISDAEFAALAPKGTRLTVDEVTRLMDAPAGSRPRVYAFWHGQIVTVASLHYVDRYRDDAEVWWLSGVTVEDLIRRA